MSNSNTESNTISNVTSLSSRSSTRKNKPSNAVLKRKANFNAAKKTLKNASNSQTNGKWKPRASNITGLVGVRRKLGDEKTFINHAISRWEKRQINREVAAEEKKQGKEAVVEAATIVNATAKAQKKRGRPKLTNEEKAKRKANRKVTRKAERNQKKQTAKNKKANKK